MCRPVPIVTSFSKLQSLAIIGTQHSIEMDVYQDLALLCNLKDLKHLTIRCQSKDDLRHTSRAVVKNLPTALESLSLEVSWRYPGDVVFETSHMKFSLAAFPAGLTSLKFKEFFVELVDSSDSFDTEATTQTDSIYVKCSSKRSFRLPVALLMDPAYINALAFTRAHARAQALALAQNRARDRVQASESAEKPVEAAAAAAAQPEDNGDSAGSSSSSSSHCNGLASLLELSAEFWTSNHATNFLR